MKIALSISGGGFRATSYGLGVLNYLNELTTPQNTSATNEQTLLQQVSGFSTVSGGSITSLAYAFSVKEKQPFNQFFNSLYDAMTNELLLDKGIANFVSNKDTNSLIMGMSKAYDELLFNNKKFGYLIPKVLNKKSDTHIEFLCINTTDFNTGSPFKFIAQAENLSLLEGNSYYMFREGTIRDYEIGIPLAASSCFPGGFEPVLVNTKSVFKDRFVKKIEQSDELNTNHDVNIFTSKKYKQLKDVGYVIAKSNDGVTSQFGNFSSPQVADNTTIQTIIEPEMEPEDQYTEEEENQNMEQLLSLMDGGIVDNQGVESIISYHKYLNDNKVREINGKVHKNEDIDLVMSIDVSSPTMSAYKPANEQKIPIIGNFKMIQLYNIIIAINVLSLFGLGWSIYINNAWGLGICTLISTMLTMTSIAMIIGKKTISKMATNSEIGIGKIRRMNDLTPNAIWQLMMNRLNSVSLLVGTVFMKHLRRKNIYDLITLPTLKNKVIINSIFQLKEQTDEDKKVKMKGLDIAEEYMQNPSNFNWINKIANCANAMGTTLWIPNNDKGQETLQATIVTGQFTTCANLLMYCHNLNVINNRNKKRYNNKQAEFDKDRNAVSIAKQVKIMEPIFNQTKTHWSKFLDDPYWLLKTNIKEPVMVKKTIV